MSDKLPHDIAPTTGFARDEKGAITILNLFLVIVMAILTGVAIDMAHLIQARTQLQVAADAAAHAALYTRDDDTKTKDEAKQAAVDIAQKIMPPGKFGDVIRTENILFGYWDRDTQIFTVSDDVSREAVYVKADRLRENANPVTSFLMQFVGYDDWDVITPSVFETYRPTCPREGIVGEEVVEIQSNNNFVNGFCIHSNQYLTVSQNNFFQAGTIVSMPNIEDIDLPSSGFEQNEGLQAALRVGRMGLRIIDRIDDIVAGMTDVNSRYFRTFITDPTPIAITLNGVNNQMSMADFSVGRVHDIDCKSSNAKITFSGETFHDIVIITDCELKMSNGTAFEDATVITKDTNDNSITAPSGLRLGKDDDCTDGGGAQLITYGGISQAADVSIFGSQLLAVGPIQFAAANDGIEGASIVSGSTVDLTSGSAMGFCGTGMTDIFEAEYFRMAS